MAAKGSWNSPIEISDDEEENEEVVGQLVEEDSVNDSALANIPSRRRNQPSEPTVDPAVEQPRTSLQKRKRDETYSQPNPGPSHAGSSNSNLETRKARKRRRRLEKEEAMALSRAQSMVPPFAMLPFLPALNPYGPVFNPYSSFGMGMPAPPPLQHKPMMYPEHGGYTPNNTPSYPVRPPPPPYNHHRHSNGHGSGGHDHRHSEPSTWVSSMAGNQNQNQDLDFWDAYPSAATTQPPLPPIEPLPPPRAPAPAHLPSPPPPAPPPPGGGKVPAQRKPVSLIIGMNPDQDKHSKHGTFHHSANAITSLPPAASSSNANSNSVGPSAGAGTGGNANAYIPNPARTLVLEQLPKTHRTREFVKAWSKAATGGAHPVYFAVDPPSAKALVEFATAELARRAWGSPKLGRGGATTGSGVGGANGSASAGTTEGAKGPPIKGKPRADLIRAWWYRVDGVGAGAGVGEIEEGEIEGDAGEGEREGSVPLPEGSLLRDADGAGTGKNGKKETKKERKARLAREREAKMGKAITPAAPSAPASAAFEGDAYIPPPPPPVSLPLRPVDTPSSTWVSLPDRDREEPALAYRTPTPGWAVDHAWDASVSASASASASTSHFTSASSTAAPTSTFTPVSASTSSFTSALTSTPAPTPTYRPPLPPQSALGTQWQQAQAQAPYRAGGWGGGGGAHSGFGGGNAPAPSLGGSGSGSFAPMDIDVDLDAGGNVDVDVEMEAEFPAPVPPAPAASSWASTLKVKSTSTSTPPYSAPGPGSAACAPSSSSRITPPSAGTAPPPRPSSSTPPHEPRAMKNAPKGPRALVARHRDLEERLARGKRELRMGVEEAGAGGTTTSAPASTTQVTLTTTAPTNDGAPGTGPGAQAAEMEDNLRKLVLRSQKSKNKPAAPMTTAESVGSSSPGAGAPPSTQPPPAIQTTAPTTEFSLDDLAVSFITETIQTLVPNGAAPLPPPPPKTVAAAASKTSDSTTTTTSTNTAKTITTTTTATRTPSAPPQTAKEALAARQKRLEAQIKESKELMAQLAGARNRGEKEHILGLMRERERSRCVASLLFRNGARRRRGRACLLSAFFWVGCRMMEEESEGQLTGKEPARTQQTQTQTYTQQTHTRMREKANAEEVLGGAPAPMVKLRWPESRNDVCVLIISDDEDEGSESEDGDD
ncbi:hypothetical protein B0H11DRAFT_15210 [Mycena galericulata]|nr:hypothetical protein B0H11DRAFT_15210 [Mycena galericulata]